MRGLLPRGTRLKDVPPGWQGVGWWEYFDGEVRRWKREAQQSETGLQVRTGQRQALPVPVRRKAARSEPGDDRRILLFVARE